MLEVALGSYSSRMLSDWSVPGGFDAAEAAARMPDVPNVWTDGRLALDEVTHISSSGLGFFAHQLGLCWSARWWILTILVLMVVKGSLAVVSVRFLGLYRPSRELSFGESPLALQSSDAVHLGVDNLIFARHVGRLLDGRLCSIPEELVNDGDLLLLIDRMLQRRGLETVRIAKVKGHADHGMVLDGRVSEQDRVGNDAADETADFVAVGGLIILLLMLGAACLESASVVSCPLSLQVFYCYFQGCG